MLIDLKKFIREERPLWGQLETALNRLQQDATWKMTQKEARHFHYLYRRASSDLSKIATFASEPRLHTYLESLVSRAYGEIHETRSRTHRLVPTQWFFRTFPRTFRRHRNAFFLIVIITMAGAVFGAGAIMLDPVAKGILMPFPQLQIDPSQRVEQAEADEFDVFEGRGAFSAMLMTHNTRVSILVLALGMTFGLGTIIVIFMNGVMLGAVACDYVLAGESTFLMGWLLPHGVIEIPAILLAGQAGLVLARALLGHGSSQPMGDRLRAVSNDVVTLIFGVAIMLVWAGIIESFFSQYHEPVLPYSVKIAFGIVEFVLLIAFLTFAGRQSADTEDTAHG